MAISFNKQKGSAQKSSMDSFAFKDGENKMRIVGDILARYVYWIEGENGKNLPLECLSFDRNAERFNNSEKDWVREYYPDLKCGWSYATQCIDPNDGKLKIVNLKKKLWEQIVQTAQDGLGDPTDIENGWDICFKRVKTGPLPYNVEYQLQVLKCKNRPLSAEELTTIAELKSMDDVMPRPTPDAQKELLDRLRTGSKDNDDEMLEEEFKVG
jgi:nitrogen fixation protein